MIVIMLILLGLWHLYAFLVIVVGENWEDYTIISEKMTLQRALILYLLLFVSL